MLLVSLHYKPEATGNSPYAAGLARGLTGDFDVNVVTAHPHYPEWRVADGYGGWRSDEVVDGVSVTRVRHYLPRSPTGFSRILSEATFASRVLAPGVPRPDVVLVMTPALAPAVSAVALGRRWNVPVGVVVQDLYGKAFAELGLFGGRLDRPVHLLERKVLRESHGVVAIHERMADVMVRDYGVARDQVTVVPNWTHVSTPDGSRDVRRRELGWDDGTLTLVHAGNLGAKQGLEHLIPIGRLIDARGLPIRIVLIGSGNARDALETSARDVDSLQFMDPLPPQTFMNTLAAADVLVLHERPGMKEMCVPSKLTSYFAASRPVLAATERDSAAAHEIQKSGAGVVIRPADPHGFLDALASLIKTDTDSLGAAGLDYARNSLDERLALDRYRQWVYGLLSVGR